VRGTQKVTQAMMIPDDTGVEKYRFEEAACLTRFKRVREALLAPFKRALLPYDC
jgi:hypothetical protein